MIKYGKSNADYVRLKSIFYDAEANRRYVELSRKMSRKYREQPRRHGCVACEHPLGSPLFTLLYEVEYCVCEICGHLNGVHEDTHEFANYVYNEATGDGSNIYGDSDLDTYMRRVDSVYLPKVEFMCDAIREEDADPTELSYVDLGAGAGHFVTAMRKYGLTDAVGYETSAQLVELANRLNGAEVLKRNDLSALGKIAATVDADVITMIFSLEHVIGLREFLGALSSNPRLKFFYFSVPVFNPSVFIEAIFPNVMSRILGNGHTHLFTDKSIELLSRDFGLRRCAEWWFGGNAFDLHRYFSVQLQSDPTKAVAANLWNEMLSQMLDTLQLAFDHHKLSSEVHLLTAVRS